MCYSQISRALKALYTCSSRSQFDFALCSPEVHRSLVHFVIPSLKPISSMQNIPEDSKGNGENKSTATEGPKSMEILVFHDPSVCSHFPCLPIVFRNLPVFVD